MKQIAILGSTGSIGKNTLRVVKAHPDRFRIKALAACRNSAVLFEQARSFRPDVVCLFEHGSGHGIEAKLRRLGIRYVTGLPGLIEISTLPEIATVVFAMVGAIGLKPVFEAVRARKTVAIANKEPLVMAGDLLLRKSLETGARIYPIDSEHSALWQCLEGHAKGAVRELILTSSGGPFRARRRSLASVTPREAIRHPRWKMGPKISVDSATLMNKGLEVIEASNLFGMEMRKIRVLVHPQAVIHGIVEFKDGSQLAHMGIADMRLPIQYALSYPERLEDSLPRLDLASLGTLTFEKPDLARFPCLALGYEAGLEGGTAPAVLNAANEIAVQAFLGKKIPFLGIPKVIRRVMKKHCKVRTPGLGEILDADAWARQEAVALCGPKEATCTF
ncbi:MAG: 1-deoxy-D-xylulose-5-phosphate reductoisomerase [Candidatus Omnitrophota bacterium]